MTRNLYPTGISNMSSYYSSSTGSTEIDLRQELINTLDGTYPEVSKKQTGLLRKMRLDSNGNLTKCPCVDSVSGEPDKDQWCSICHNEGNLWDETQVTFYRVLENAAGDDVMTAPGSINIKLITFYLRYSDTITDHDKLVQLRLDNEGVVSIPLTRIAICRINRFWDYRADNGRIEFYKVYTNQENVKFLNPPTFEDQWNRQ